MIGHAEPAALFSWKPMFTGYVFTLTGGRTGTAWLAELLADNLAVPVVHEPLEIDDFGVAMPDIRTMRSFNDRGNDAVVTAFWNRKRELIARQPSYIETNHTLAKCGLIENIADSPLAAASTIIILTRDKADCCASYLLRGDFANATMEWSWFLSPRYRNNIIGYEPFAAMKEFGRPVWFVHEMEARQHYYARLFGGRLRFIAADLAALNTPSGADALLQALGHDGPVRLPPARNVGALQADPSLRQALRTILASVTIDTGAAAEAYIAAGRRLCAPSPIL
jgi:hypothetical protein